MGARKEFRGLTGLRGFAALWVFFFHFKSHMGITNTTLNHFLESGWLGVDLSFVLSGFVITYVYYNSCHLQSPTFLKEYKQFLIARLARCYPLHLFIIVLFLASYLVTDQLGYYHRPQGIATVPGLLLTASLLNGWGIEILGWNYLSWSVSAEWLAYLCFPLLFRLFSTDSLNTRKSTGLLLLIFITTLLFSIGYNDWNGPKFLPIAFTSIRVLSSFTLGMLTYQLHLCSSEFCNKQANGLFLLLTIAIFTLPSITEANWTPYAYIALFPILIFTIAQSRETALPHKILGNKVMIYLGKISYSIYLSHGFIMLCHKHALRLANKTEYAGLIENNQQMITLCVFTLTLVASHILFHCIEQPARSKIRAHFKKQ